MSTLIDQELTEQVIGALIEVHRYWGPGLLEEIYERSVRRELTIRGIPFVSQLKLPLIYKDTNVGEDLRLDFLINFYVSVLKNGIKRLVL